MKSTLTRKRISLLCALIFLMMTVGACGGGDGGDATGGDAGGDAGDITNTEVITE